MRRRRRPPRDSSGRRRAALWPVFAALLLAALSACDHHDPAMRDLPPSNAPPPPPDLPPVQNGVFKDSNVAGLTFVSGREQGVTDAAGRYTCETDTDIEFSLGALTIGSAECATLVIPPSLVPSGVLSDVRTLNIARFLLMLDSDGEPENGITISNPVRQLAASWAQVDFSTTDLDAELAAIVSDAASVDGTPHALPTATDALAHLGETASCAYAGAFSGPFSGDYRGAMTMAVGIRRSTPLFQGRAFEWLGFDNLENWEFGGSDASGVELSAAPTINHVRGDDTLTAAYVTPDVISGTWVSSNGNESVAFSLERLGDDTGTFRFVGLWGDFRQDGVLTLKLDDDVVSGQAYDPLRGRRAQISGVVDGHVMSLAITGQAVTTAVGTVTFDQNGAPISVAGTWSRTGDFQAVACRLN